MITTRRAFTLVEILVVIGIIAVLAAMIIPTINLVRTKARVTVTGQRDGRDHLLPDRTWRRDALGS